MKPRFPAFALFTIIGCTILLVGWRWDDVKLRMTRYWGLRTIENNPLLPSFDKDLQNADVYHNRIDLDDLLSGGPPKDGIPAVENPQFDTADTTPFTKDEVGLGVMINGEAKFYPYGILNWHEIVNDTIGGVPVSVTLCPLCDTGITFERMVDGQETTFGVSGKLFQSCLIMYDRLTDTLWSQPWGLGVVGKQTSESLTRFPTIKTTLERWLTQYPSSLILSTDTGYNRDYFRYPYGSYLTNSSIIFPARNQNLIVDHPKDIETYYWEADDGIPPNQFSGLRVRFRNDEVEQEGSITQEVDGRTLTAQWDNNLQTVRVYENGRELTTSTAFGFVYPAFFE